MDGAEGRDEDVTQLGVGSRSGRPTVYTVAAQAGVSVATVSRVLQDPDRVREATRAKVLDAIDALDYVPHGAARSLASRRHEAHGLVLPELAGPYYSELLIGYQSQITAHGDSLILALLGESTNPDRQVRSTAARVDGIALMGASRLADPARTVAALQRKVPVVGLGASLGLGLETFATANLDSAQGLTRHLLDHGRTRLLFVGDPGVAPDVEQRYAGFERALGGTAPDPLRCGLRERDGQDAADQLLAGRSGAADLPDALVCANDEVALAVMQRLRFEGIGVPDDVAVVGWDDVMAARHVRPALTTVRQPIRELGAAVARRLGERIAGSPPPEEPVEHVLPTTVVLRRSCGCPDPDPST